MTISMRGYTENMSYYVIKNILFSGEHTNMLIITDLGGYDTLIHATMAVDGSGSSVHIATSVLSLSIQKESISLAGNDVTLHIKPIPKRI